MVKFIKKMSERLSNKMMAPGAEEADYFDEYDEDYDEDYDDYDDEPEIQLRPSKQEKNPPRSNSSKSNSTSRNRNKDNVYGFNPGTPLAVHKQTESIIIHPKGMEDAIEVGQHVRSGRMCIVDLTGVPTSEAQRVADYLCGNTDALDGAITRVNNTIIAVSPPNHRVMPDYREENPFDGKFLKAAR